MTEGVVRLRVWVGVGACFCEEVLEIPAEELDGLDDKERQKVFLGWYEDWLSNQIDSGWVEEV